MEQDESSIGYLGLPSKDYGAESYLAEQNSSSIGKVHQAPSSSVCKRLPKDAPEGRTPS